MMHTGHIRHYWVCMFIQRDYSVSTCCSFVTPVPYMPRVSLSLSLSLSLCLCLPVPVPVPVPVLVCL